MYVVIKFGSFNTYGPFPTEAQALEYKRIKLIEGVVRPLDMI